MQQILTGSKVLVSALCHEIRNVCGAIAVLHSKLAREKEFALNEDFADSARHCGVDYEALLQKIIALGLRYRTGA